MFTRPELTRHPTDLSAIWKPQRGPQLFDTYDELNTCISIEPHEHAVKDPVQHYFGCIEICQRPNFFDDSNHAWVNEREVERKKLISAMAEAHLSLPTDDIKAKVDETVKEKMINVAVAIEAWYKRTKIMRRVIMKSPSSSGQPGLIADVQKSRHKWMNFQRFEDGIPVVRKWREGTQKGHRPVDDVSPGQYIVSDRIQAGREEVQRFIEKHGNKNRQNPHPAGFEYSIERDIYAHVIEFTVQEAKVQASPGTDATSNMGRFLKPADDELTNAGVKKKTKKKRSQISAFSMSRLLNNRKNLKNEQCDPNEDWNILRRDRSEDISKPRKIRYLHVPSNNMAWIEVTLSATITDCTNIKQRYIGNSVR